MDNAWPLWALPFWTMGVPLVWAFVELKRIPARDSAPTNFGVRERRTVIASPTAVSPVL